MEKWWDCEKLDVFFEKLLPYAIAFGVEKKWAKRFEDKRIPCVGDDIKAQAKT